MRKLIVFASMLATVVLCPSAIEAATLPVTSQDGQVTSEFRNDGFDYSFQYFNDNFTYTYIDEQGVSVTVPITTPATTPAAMIALLREVYSNPNIPGRQWVYGDERVDYTPSAEAAKVFGLDPNKEYRPNLDGLTCLLVEGTDDAGETSLDDDMDLMLSKLQRITLVTSRVAIENNTTPNGVNNPGYLFNVTAPLHKFYFITKGKARATDYMPLFNLFEEYSPNNGGKEQEPKDVHTNIMAGQAYYVTHDCSSALGNQGHIMVMESETDSYPLVNLSIFIPHFRSFDDVDKQPDYDLTHEPYTWYHPNHQPFFYRYTIDLEAESTPIADDFNHQLVTVSWNTNFRKLFDTPLNGEFRVYKVIDDVIDYDNPITFSATAQAGTVIDGVRVLSNDPTGVVVQYLEPITDTPRSITYIVGGRPEGMVTSYTFSNTDDVEIPAYGQSELFRLNLKAVGSSKFNDSKSVNDYVNTLVLVNPEGNLELKRGDMALGGRFDFICNDQTLAYMVVERKQFGGNVDTDGDKNYYSLVLYNADGTPANKEYYWYSDVVSFNEHVDPVALHNNNMQPILDRDSGSRVLVSDFTHIFSERITDNNDHPGSYTYRIVYTKPSGDRHFTNTDDVAIFKSYVVIRPRTYTFDEVLNDEEDHALETVAYEAVFDVSNDAHVTAYTLRLAGSDNVLAMITRGDEETASAQHSKGGRKYSKVTAPVRDSKEHSFEVVVPIIDHEANADILASWESHKWVVEIEAAPTLDAAPASTYGTPRTNAAPMPRLIFNDAEIVSTASLPSPEKPYGVDLRLTTDLSELQSADSGYEYPSVSHYVAWVDEDGGSNFPEPRRGYYPLKGESKLDWIKYDSYLSKADDNTEIYISHGLDAVPATNPNYLVRAYVKAIDRNTGEPSYLIAEATKTATYQGHVSTGVDDVLTDGDVNFSVAVSGNTVTISAQSLVSIYTASGVLVGQYDPKGSSISVDLARGLYIATNGDNSVKLQVR